MTKPLHHARALMLLRGFLLAVALLLGLRFSVGLLRTEAALLPGDFLVYWRACERLVAGASYYLPSDSSPYKYSPTFTYLFRGTFYLLPPWPSAALWMLLSVFTFFGGFYAMAAKLLARAARPGFFLGLVVLGTVLSWRGFLETLNYGQADLFLAGGFFFIVASGLSAGRAVWRALIWALLLITKPHLGVLFLPAAFAFGWREGLRIAGVTLAAYLVPTLWLGPVGLLELFRAWANCLLVQQDIVFLTNTLNQSLGAVAARVFGVPALAGNFIAGFLAVYLLALGILAALAGKDSWWRGPREERVRLAWFGFGLAAYLAFSPLSWRWLIADWAPVLALAAALETRVRFYLPWLAAALLSQKFVAEPLGLAAQDQISFYGFYALGSLGLYIFFKWLVFREIRKASDRS